MINRAAVGKPTLDIVHIQNSGERVSHPPVMLVAEGDLVVLTRRCPPQPDRDQPSDTYTAYRIAIWRVRDHKLCEH